MSKPKFPFYNHLGFNYVSHEPGKSHHQLKIQDFHFNPQAVVHGGVHFALADTGMGSALFPMLDKGQICATIEIKMTYFKAVRKGKLDCHTIVLNKGKRVAMMESEIWNEGHLVAKATGSFSIFTPNRS